MRHVVTDPRPGAVVRVRPGDWLEIRFTSRRPGFHWRVADRPGWLLSLPDEPGPERPTVLPPAPRSRALGFLAFAGEGPARLRLELAHERRRETVDVRELAVVVG